jgi:hypothetical protein
MLHYFLRSKKPQKPSLIIAARGGSTCRNVRFRIQQRLTGAGSRLLAGQEYRLHKTASTILGVGQHARISIAQNRKPLKNEVGQHAGTVGQHKQEWWVNMVRNLQPDKLFAISRALALLNLVEGND